MPSVATVPVQEESATGPPIAAISHGDDRHGEGPARSRLRLPDLFTMGVSQPPEWGFHDTIGHADTLFEAHRQARQPVQPARGHVHNGQQIPHQLLLLGQRLLPGTASDVFAGALKVEHAQRLVFERSNHTTGVGVLEKLDGLGMPVRLRDHLVETEVWGSYGMAVFRPLVGRGREGVGLCGRL